MKSTVALLLCVALAYGLKIDLKPIVNGETENQGDEFAEGDIKIAGGEGADRNMISDKNKRWPIRNGVAYIPYAFDASKVVSNEVRRGVLAAAKQYAQWTCIKLIPRTREADYINIINSGGCWSYIGKSGGKQPLSLGNNCFQKGTIAHEFMHALGFDHEQNRQDRDNYVRINEANIHPDKRHNYAICKTCTLPKAGYDYSSVMHYGSDYFSSNGRPAMEALTAGAKMGQRSGFSKGDMKKLGELYECNGRTLEDNTGLEIPSEEPIDGASNCRDYKDLCSDENIQKACARMCSGKYDHEY